jgi:hypothetical protein
VAYVKASNTAAAAHFGSEVAISADGAIVAGGSVDESSAGVGVDSHQTAGTAPASGAAYVFVATRPFNL